jgi:hypothetical protein
MPVPTANPPVPVAVASTEPAVREPAAAPAAGTVDRRTPDSVWVRVVGDPGHAPELLALAAVETIGPRAAEWARRMRETYPAAGADELALLAGRRFIRQAGVGGAASAAAGILAPVAALAAGAWTQAELALHVAAVYGHDPADRARATDLLVLLRVHPDREQAEAALAEMVRPEADRPEPVAEAVWRLAAPLAVQAARWTALRTVARLLPGAAVLGGAFSGAAAAQQLIARVRALYRPSTGRG